MSCSRTRPYARAAAPVWVLVLLVGALVGLVLPADAEATAITTAPSTTVSPFQVTISWRTDVSSTTEVYFGQASQTAYTAYPRASTFTSVAGIVHSRTLLNLSAGTWYYRVRSVDAGGAPVVSNEGSFAVSAATAADHTDLLVTDGSVNAIAEAGTTTYLGGSFSQVGPRRGSLVGLNTTNGGVLHQDAPLVEGSVYSSVPDGAGGLFIGGAFTSVGGLPRNNLARILPDGGVDQDGLHRSAGPGAWRSLHLPSTGRRCTSVATSIPPTV